MKKYITYIILGSLLQGSCQEKKMENKTSFVYSMEISAPREYPVEVHEGVLSNGKNFISAIPKAGIARSGWGFGGADAGMKASGIPNHLELTWISYAEKKFWKVDTALPEEKILALFQKGYKYIDNLNVEHQDTYKKLVIGLAPGGVVVVWLQGVFNVEIGRFQAKEIYVNKLDFQPVKDHEESQEEYFVTGFNIVVPQEAQENIKKEGIPFGLWDEYRVKYNWRFHTLSYKGGVEEVVTFKFTQYFNGECAVFFKDAVVKNNYNLQAVPYRSDFTYKDYSSSVEFNEKEIFAAFKALTQKHINKPIEIIVKVTFMYKGLSFIVKCENDEIPLKNVKVKMYTNS